MDTQMDIVHDIFTKVLEFTSQGRLNWACPQENFYEGHINVNKEITIIIRFVPSSGFLHGYIGKDNEFLFSVFLSNELATILREKVNPGSIRKSSVESVSPLLDTKFLSLYILPRSST